MDGLECSEILLSHAKREESRFDSEYYSKENLLLQTIIDTAGNKTINEYGGVLDCSAFYPSITGYYSNDRSLIPFIRVNEIANGLILITDNTVFLPANIIEDNNKTIAVAYPGDIIIAKGGNTLAKVGLVTDEFPMYATCRYDSRTPANKKRQLLHGAELHGCQRQAQAAVDSHRTSRKGK